MSTPGQRAGGNGGVGWVEPITKPNLRRDKRDKRWIGGTWTRAQFAEIERLLEAGEHGEALDLVRRINRSLND